MNEKGGGGGVLWGFCCGVIQGIYKGSGSSRFLETGFMAAEGGIRGRVGMV